MPEPDHLKVKGLAKLPCELNCTVFIGQMATFRCVGGGGYFL